MQNSSNYSNRCWIVSTSLSVKYPREHLNRDRGVPAERKTSWCNTVILHMCWVGSELQEIQLNCQHLGEGNCRCPGDVMTETGAGSRSPVPGKGLLWQLTEKALLLWWTTTTMEAWRQMLACPVCLELFTPPILILPCAHNFCKQCLEKIMLHQNCHHVNGLFHCPLCRKVRRGDPTCCVEAGQMPHLGVRRLLF